MKHEQILERIIKWNADADVETSEKQKESQLNMLYDEVMEYINYTSEENKIKELCDILFVAVGYFYVSNCGNLAKTLRAMDSGMSFAALMEKSMHRDMYIITIASKALYMLEASGNIAALDAVIDNNFSKFCQSRDELSATLNKYQAMGVACNYRVTESGYVVYSAVDQHVGGKFFPKMKILKNASYKECVLDGFKPIFSD